MTNVVAVQRILAESATGVIFSARKASGDYVRVRVSEPFTVKVGDIYSVQGPEANYVDSAGRLWRQIEATEVQRETSSGRLLVPWLERLPHLGPVRARRLLDVFGDDLLDVLSDPSSIESVAVAIDPQRPIFARRIAAAVILETSARLSEESVLVAEARFLRRLEGHGVTDRRAAKQLWRLLGSTASEDRLLQNPYLAASMLNWKQADHLGLALLVGRADVDDPTNHIDRMLGAIDNVWRTVLATGDTALCKHEMRRQLQRRGVDPDKAIAAGMEKALTAEVGGLYRAPGAAWIEDDLVQRLQIIAKQPAVTCEMTSHEIGQVVLDAESAVGFPLTGEQREAVTRLLGQPFGVLQGGAGVGKTAVAKVICEAWENLGGTSVLTALSGKAALQLSRGASSSRRPRIAYTAARLLRILSARARLERDGIDPPIDWPLIDSRTLLLVDEASMIDTPTLRHLVENLVPGAHLLCVGDHGQLPSVGLGKVFHDLVDNGKFVVRLNTVLRQAETSQIPSVAAAIRDGRVPELMRYAGQDAGVFILPTSEREKFRDWKTVYEELCSRYEQTNVIALAALNASVEWLNSESAGGRHRGMEQQQLLRLGPFATVGIGDPVVCRQNRYADSLFNGMLGVVTETDSEGQISIHWDGEPEPRQLSIEAAGDIGLGFAITCHKSQGSSARAVVVLLENSRLVTREWIYTAITRARDLVVLVGDPNVLDAAIDRRAQRTTGFRFEH